MTSAPPTNKDRLPIVNDEKNLSSDEEKRQAINKEKPLIKKEIIPEPFEASRLQARPQPHKIETEKQISFFDNKDQNFAPKKNYKVIGQAFDTYFLVESDDILYMIDQHAAHEKVFYENFMKSVNEHKIYSQQLLPATVVTLSLSEADTLRVNIEEFRKFGGNDFKITAVPSDLFGVDVKELFDQILNGLNEPRAGEPRVLSERIALRSCKSAVKANTRFTAEDAKLLINKLFELEDPYHCPHGRPTMISLTHSELDKKFKRT